MPSVTHRATLPSRSSPKLQKEDRARDCGMPRSMRSARSAPRRRKQPFLKSSKVKNEGARSMLVSFKICIAFLVLVPALVFPQGVIRCPDANGSLGVRWNWAKKEASSRGANGYWIGYSFMREMEKNSMVG